MTSSHRKGGSIALSFLSHGRVPQSPYRIGWPSDRPLLWAALWVKSGKVRLSAMYKSFLTANIPLGHRVYFGVAIEGEHSALKPMLEEGGDPYYEKEEWGFTGRGKKLRFLFASTERIPIVELAIEGYKFEWMTYFLFPFLVAKEEPRKWKEQLENFMKDKIVTEEVIEESHCFITTQYEHAIEIVSNKLTSTSLEQIAKSIAVKHGLELRVVETSVQKTEH